MKEKTRKAMVYLITDIAFGSGLLLIVSAATDNVDLVGVGIGGVFLGTAIWVIEMTLRSIFRKNGKRRIR